MKKIFIAAGHDRENDYVVESLKKRLAKFEMTAWAFDDLELYADWTNAAQDAIRQSSVVIAVLTQPNASVYYEIGYAEGLGKRVVILRDPEVKLPSSMYSFQTLQIPDGEWEPSFLYELLESLVVESEYGEEQHEDRSLRELSENPERIFEISREHRSSFERIDNATFERLVGALFERRGCHIERRPAPSVATFDFVISDFGSAKRVIAEVKKYSANSKISVGQVQQLLGAVVAEKADYGVLISPSEFTGSAIDFARSCEPPIELWNLRDLEKRLAEVGDKTTTRA